MLTKSGRKVTLLEGTDDIGGHSKTWVEPVDGGDLPIDIGFIFNNVHYYKYINFTTYFDYPLHDTALNTSGAFNGSALAVLVSPNRVVAWTSRHGRGTASAGHRLGASLPAQSLTKPRKD
ncbi:unnamed protein product [Durusdinium trenchii]|uniref:Amine oxidase n=1 Tax=Durusdinium trenchii TaxID=1381693 RepID=A0ABP0Q4V3_9DINO